MKLMTIAREGQTVGYAFFCPGCEEVHAYYTVNWRNNPVWAFNGNLEKPTFTPSLLFQEPPTKRCHLFMTGGVIQFLADSSHKLAGQSVEIPEWPHKTSFLG